MTNKQKIKGSKFERDAAKELSVNSGEWKRTPGSGSLGTNLGMPDLMGDVSGKYPWFTKKIKAENKVGYGTSKQITVKRQWFTKVREQANLDNKYPCVLLKFDDVTGGDLGSAKIICFNFDTFNSMMADIEELYVHYLKLLEREFNDAKA